MKIIITGGSGLIGTDLSRLLKKDHDVTSIDIKESKEKGCNFKFGNIENLEEVVKLVKNCDVVIHLAAALGVVNTELNPIKTLDVNMLGTKNVLEACRINKIKKIIYSSSSEIYGEPLKIPIEESDKIMPITTYGVSKMCAEEYVKSYARIYGIRYTIFRMFNVYGDEQDTQWVVPEFVSKAVQNKDITIHEDGRQIRAFCYVSDVSDAFSYALEKGDNEIFNIGNNSEPISIKELALKTITLANSQSTIKFVSFDKSCRNRTEIIKRVPDIQKAKRILGYEPTISLTDGIKRVIQKNRNK